MRKNVKKLFAGLVILALLSGCAGVSKMIKNYPLVKYEVEPKVLEVKGDKMTVSVKGKIPENYFHKKAIVEIIPILKYENGEYALKPIILQGESIKDKKGTVISKVSGGNFSYTDVIDYKPEYNVSELYVTPKVTYKNKTQELGKTKLADGTIYTCKRIGKDENLIIAENKYDKSEKINSKKGNIYFPYAEARLDFNLPLNKNKENKKILEDLMKYIISANDSNLNIKNFDINAWASPEGEVQYNQDLSDRRAKAASNYLTEQLKKAFNDMAKKKKIKPNSKEYKDGLQVISNYVINLTARGEDWEGFMKAVDNSNIKDKNIIMNIVNSQTDLQKREQEIRNMAVIYKEIEKGILPALRRAEISVNTVVPRKTDEQILNLATSKPDSLEMEELLYASTLTKDVNTQMAIYKSFVALYPQDWRGYNNVAYLQLKQGNITEASSNLEKANTLSSNNGIVLNNLGVIAAWKKDYKTAKSYYESAQQAGQNTSYNMGILSIVSGDYATAISNMSSKNCAYNLALAQLLNKDPKKALSTLDCIQDKDANTYYLMAIAGARMNDNNILITNLKKAIQMDSSLRKQAENDREFIKFFENDDFKGLVK